MRKKRGTKPFVSWDGEGSKVNPGERQPYMLFGNSDCQYIMAPQLTTKACLQLILRSRQDAIHFGFAFGYDVNQILCDLPAGALFGLARNNRCRWEGYKIEYIPGKWFQVSAEGVSRKIFDVFHYFNCSLVAALDKYLIGTHAQRTWIEEQKANRPEFTWDEIDEVIKYWKLEGHLMVELMTYLRKLFNDAGFYPSSWHGPGALARVLLNNHQIRHCRVDMRKHNIEVWIAARYAYCGGRFQQWLAGLYEGQVYNYDINSAYPYAIQFLPNLATGKWRRNIRINRSRIHRDRFCLYHIRYDEDKLEKPHSSVRKRNRPRPLFRRLKNDAVFWPNRVEGWYWSPEAELVKDDPAAEFLEEWAFEDDGDRPFAFIADIYQKREYHKALGNAIENAFKLAMNSCYGQFAQRTGWKSMRPPGPPTYHQLEWAGFITSMCRAMIHRAAAYAWKKGGLITVDTDGIYSTVPVPDNVLINGIGDGLGQWGEKKYEGILIWQNGFYWLKKDGVWSEAKSRGAPRGKVPIEAAWKALPNLEPIRYEKTQFVGFKLALQQHGQNWRSWQPEPREVDFGGGPHSKMQHIYNPKRGSGFCVKCVTGKGELHNTIAMYPSHGEYTGKYKDTWSYMHNLPWVRMDEKTIEDDPMDDPEILKAIYGDSTL